MTYIRSCVINNLTKVCIHLYCQKLIRFTMVMCDMYEFMLRLHNQRPHLAFSKLWKIRLVWLEQKTLQTKISYVVYSKHGFFLKRVLKLIYMY